MNAYEWADKEINSCPKCATGFTQLLSSNPYIVSSHIRNQYESRLSFIRDFQLKAIKLFKSALNKETDPILLHWMINETPEHLAVRYHRSLEERHFSLPLFFRTDEASPGRIVEIQCPGSLWGELELTFEYANMMGWLKSALSPAAQFTSQLSSILQEMPIVHHLLDNASGPAGMRYFIEKTRPLVRYWGIDFGIWPVHCNYIRSHSFFGLCAENEFRSRLLRVGKGITYDLPPHVLFDQKATLVLPFWSITRELFSDDTRDLFLFSSPLLPNGIELIDGTQVTIKEFASLPRSKRSYYLKYAGSDVSMNWGSKAVFRLSNLSSNSCLELLNRCINQYNQGKIWLVQKEEVQDDSISFLTRDATVQSKNLRAKLSAFYGPYGCLGILAMHRPYYKVHAKSDTVISYVLAEG